MVRSVFAEGLGKRADRIGGGTRNQGSASAMGGLPTDRPAQVFLRGQIKRISRGGRRRCRDRAAVSE